MTNRTKAPATEKQLGFLMALVNERQIDDEAKAQIVQRISDQDITKARASDWIERLMDRPKIPGTADSPPPSAVPAGRYALLAPSGEWVFLQVWRGTRNPNVVHVYAMNGTERGDRVSRSDEKALLSLIEKDPKQAAIEYGLRSGRCYRCNAELENNLSRMLSMGPVCMKHVYSDDDRYAKLADARQELRAQGLDPEGKLDAIAR